MRIYLDSAILIYWVEGNLSFVPKITLWLSQPQVIQVVSELSRLECRVKPLRDRNLIVLQAFDHYFANIVTSVVPLSRAIVNEATRIRAERGFKTPDALHLAAAFVHNCDVFLTHDLRLSS